MDLLYESIHTIANSQKLNTLYLAFPWWVHEREWFLPNSVATVLAIAETGVNLRQHACIAHKKLDINSTFFMCFSYRTSKMIIQVILVILFESIWPTLFNVCTAQCSAHEASSMGGTMKDTKHMVVMCLAAERLGQHWACTFSPLLHKQTLETIPLSSSTLFMAL